VLTLHQWIDSYPPSNEGKFVIRGNYDEDKAIEVDWHMLFLELSKTNI